MGRTTMKLRTPRRYKIVNKRLPLIERALQVRLPSGRLSSVNVFDFNLASAVHSFDPKKHVTVQLSDQSWIQVGSLTPIFEAKRKRRRR